MEFKVSTSLGQVVLDQTVVFDWAAVGSELAAALSSEQAAFLAAFSREVRSMQIFFMGNELSILPEEDRDHVKLVLEWLLHFMCPDAIE